LFNPVEFENRFLDYYLSIRATNTPRFLGGLKTEIEIISTLIEKELKK